LRVIVIGIDRFLKILDCTFLASKAVALLVMKPSKLLEDLRVVWIALQNALVSLFGTVMLDMAVSTMKDVKC